MVEDNDRLQIPILPLRGINLFPEMLMHFDVKREKSIIALEYAMERGQRIFLVAQRDAQVEDPSMAEELYPYGTVGKVRQILKMPKDIMRVLVMGESRGYLEHITSDEPFLLGQVVIAEEESVEMEVYEKEAFLATAHETIREYTRLTNKYSKEVIERIMAIKDIGRLADAMAFNLMTSLENKQSILANTDSATRMKLTITVINAEIEVLKIKNDIQDQVKLKMDKNQKEYYLREQIKVIQNELGEQQSMDQEMDEFTQRMKKLSAGEDVLERIDKEIKRFKKIPLGSSESTVSRNYIEWLLDMPWLKKTEESLDLDHAQRILDEDHYGLEKVKERVLEHLAVRKLSNKTDSPIICLVGPPGTGKTSIAKSIARALSRNYSRISLGGVRDEAEIRGHRKTYVGAMPGRIATAIKFAGTSNPLILLDEVDKMSNDFRGDPSAALLEVLDSEQNSKFRDHFLEVPIDLSDVLFIATANSLRNIPRPLLDRLELIEISSYTDQEKCHIGKRYLLPKQLGKHGLSGENLQISDSGWMTIIHDYTREAGVRNLERKVGEICRKVAREVYKQQTGTDLEAAVAPAIKLNDKNIKKYLGTPTYRTKRILEKPQIGIARGLAWTEVGGDTLSIEVNIMDGTGKFELTGQLGDVMKESARAAISYIRSKADELPLKDPNFYTKKDIHIHIPDGAVPKDGPSAGITMALAMISALTGVPVDNEIAMTGEITIRGRVLPIGGLKEKLLAAKRAGIKTVLVPQDNKRHVDEMSKEITRGLRIVFVSEMDQVLSEALMK